MTKRIAFLALTLILSACARPHVKVVRIDPAFQSLVNSFEADGSTVNFHVQINDLIVQFTDQLTSETLGECVQGDDATPTINIDAQDWYNETPEYQKIILYHELGHCVLDRVHVFTGTILKGNCSATSIMYPYIEDFTNMYAENWQWYVQELFYPAVYDSVSQNPGEYCSFNDYWGGT